MWDLLRDYWPAIAYLLEIAFRIFMIVVVLGRRRVNPSATMAWIILIIALPIVGAVLYFLIGDITLGRRARDRHAALVKNITEREAALHGEPTQRPTIRPEHESIARLADAVADRPPRSGNRLQLFNDSAAVIQAMVEDIDTAQHHCHLLFYIYLDDHAGRRVGDALTRAVKRGVQCRLLVDAVGARSFLNSATCARMRDEGVQVTAALPVNPLRMLFARIDLRNHRKIAVIDSKVGYTGSQNIADPEFTPRGCFAPWCDCMVRADGPVVRDLQMLFVEDWYMDTDDQLDEALERIPLEHDDGVVAQVVGSGPDADTEAMRQIFQAAMHLSRDELILTTPYFVPDMTTVTALCTAARRGVQTTLVLPARNDSPLVAAASRSHYAALLESGVQLYEFTGGLLHVKTLTLDRDLAILGSANLDRRSFELNFEVSMLVYDTDFASQLRFMQRSYINDAREITASSWRARHWVKGLVDNAAGMMSPLL